MIELPPPLLLPLLLLISVTPNNASETRISDGLGGSCSTNATETSFGHSTSPEYGTLSRALPDELPHASANIRRNVDLPHLYN